MRGVVPNALTAVRVPLGAVAVIASADGRLALAATMISIGAVTDGIDGWAARRLNVNSSFGALFDCFCDYLCFVVAPWMLMRSLLSPQPSVVREALLMVPLLTGAIRYARNGLTVSSRREEVRALPGLGTVFFAFWAVTLVFLELPPDTLANPSVAWTLTAVAVLFSVLMIVPITYPKLSSFPGASPFAIVLIACMPFVGTRALAAITLAGGLLYAMVAPLLARKALRAQHTRV